MGVEVVVVSYMVGCLLASASIDYSTLYTYFEDKPNYLQQAALEKGDFFGCMAAELYY